MACVWFTVAFWSLHSKARLTTQTQCVKRAVATDGPLTAFVCVPLTGRTDPIPIVVKYDVMGMGRMEMEVSLPGSGSCPVPCHSLHGSWGVVREEIKKVRIHTSEVKKNLLLNQHKKMLLLKIHTLFNRGYLSSGCCPKFLGFAIAIPQG